MNQWGVYSSGVDINVDPSLINHFFFNQCRGVHLQKWSESPLKPGRSTPIIKYTGVDYSGLDSDPPFPSETSTRRHGEKEPTKTTGKFSRRWSQGLVVVHREGLNLRACPKKTRAEKAEQFNPSRERPPNDHGAMG